MRRVNAQLLEDHVNLDEIIEYTVNAHLVHKVSNEVDTTNQSDMLLAHMSGQLPSPNVCLVNFDMFLLLNEVIFTRNAARLRSMRHSPIRKFLRLVIVPNSLVKAKP
jgi:hypothetical protein